MGYDYATREEALAAENHRPVMGVASPAKKVASDGVQVIRSSQVLSRYRNGYQPTERMDNLLLRYDDFQETVLEEILWSLQAELERVNAAADMDAGYKAALLSALMGMIDSSNPRGRRKSLEAYAKLRGFWQEDRATGAEKNRQSTARAAKEAPSWILPGLDREKKA